MMLAFLIDQVQARWCNSFKAARANYHALCVLWGKVRVYFLSMLIPDWISLWRVLALATRPQVALPIVPR
jgi:hypothetical protein